MTKYSSLEKNARIMLLKTITKQLANNAGNVALLTNQKEGDTLTKEQILAQLKESNPEIYNQILPFVISSVEQSNEDILNDIKKDTPVTLDSLGSPISDNTIKAIAEETIKAELNKENTTNTL